MQKVPSETLPIDRKERLTIPYLDLPLRDPKERICDFDDIHIPLTPEEAQREAARCIHCPDPAPCMEACPVHNDIPSAMWLIEQGRFLEAAALYRETSSMPEICSRVCPHEVLCQGGCVRSAYDGTVQTGMLERFVVDYERRVKGGLVEVPVGKPTGHSVAVVGAGPAGLSCAEQLRQRGHDVTIFEAKPAAGGLLVYGIPNFKLTKDVVFARVDDLKAAGVKFVLNTKIGKDKTIDDLFAEGFEAVFIGVGANVDAPMKVPGNDLKGVMPATEYLVRANVPPDIWPEEYRGKEPLEVEGKKVIVVGGGDTAADCLRTSVRLKAAKVTCVYRRSEAEMPGGEKDRKWAREEGAEYQFLTQPVEFIGDDQGRLKAVKCVRMKLGEPDESGRRRPIPIEGSEFVMEADFVILAIGYWPDETIGKTTPNLKTYKWGLIVTDPETGETSRPGVYAGGDAATGPDLVVTAVAAGRRAAAAIHEYLLRLEKAEGEQSENALQPAP